MAPVFNENSVQMGDPIFFFFVGWSLYFFWRAISVPQSLFFVLTAISSVLAFFCRIEGVLLFGVFFQMLLVLAIKHESERRPLLKGMALMVGLPLGLGLAAGGYLMLVPEFELASFSRLGEPMSPLKAILNGDFLARYHRLYEEIKSVNDSVGTMKSGSFSRTARRFLWLIYLVSVAERLARNLFIFFILPLFSGFGKRPKLNRGHWLILFMAGTFFLAAYYHLSIIGLCR